jgi:hypothetical protein
LRRKAEKDPDGAKGIPKPRTIDELRTNPEFRDDAVDAVIAVVPFRVEQATPLALSAKRPLECPHLQGLTFGPAPHAAAMAVAVEVLTRLVDTNGRTSWVPTMLQDS